MLAGVETTCPSVSAGIPASSPLCSTPLRQAPAARYAVDVQGAAGTRYSVGVPLPGQPGVRPGSPDPSFSPLSPPTCSPPTSPTRPAHARRIRRRGYRGRWSHTPPGPGDLRRRGELVYGPRDEVDLEKLRQLGLPYWLAGAYAGPAALARALELGASGIQVGSAFALCEESGFEDSLKRDFIEAALPAPSTCGPTPSPSPTRLLQGLPTCPGPSPMPEVYERRRRVSEAGYLRLPYRGEDGG